MTVSRLKHSNTGTKKDAGGEWTTAKYDDEENDKVESIHRGGGGPYLYRNAREYVGWKQRDKM